MLVWMKERLILSCKINSTIELIAVLFRKPILALFYLLPPCSRPRSAFAYLNDMSQVVTAGRLALNSVSLLISGY